MIGWIIAGVIVLLVALIVFLPIGYVITYDGKDLLAWRMLGPIKTQAYPSPKKLKKRKGQPRSGDFEEFVKQVEELATDVAKIYADAQSANIELYKFLLSLDTYAKSVDETTILVVKANEYPFNILSEYAKSMTVEGNDMVVSDLTYILSQLPEKDRKALIDGVSKLIAQSAKSNGIPME